MLDWIRKIFSKETPEKPSEDTQEAELRKKELERKRLEQKRKRKEENDRRANEELKRELEVEQQKQQNTTKEKPKEQPKVQIPENKIQKKESMLEKLEKNPPTGSILFVYADVKRVRAIEWIDGKKRTALNKEREVRRTHKGGWSQEKFQRFVRAKKGKSNEWIEEVLTREGVLRPPYDRIYVDSLLDLTDILSQYGEIKTKL